MADRRGSGTVQRPEDDQVVRQRASELHDGGMPFQMAMAVAHGRMDLSEALERMARKDRAHRLEAEHGISHAVATQVAMGQVPLEQVLYRRRFAVYREEHLDTTAFVVGFEGVVITHDGRYEGVVEAVSAYEIQLGEQALHKLSIQLLHARSEWKRAKKAIRVDKDVASLELGPVERPQDRYGCSDKRLFGYLDGEREITATTRGGFVVKGRLTRFSRFEFDVKARSGMIVTVLRHALHDLQPSDR